MVALCQGAPDRCPGRTSRGGRSFEGAYVQALWDSVGARGPHPAFSTKLSMTFFSPALSKATVSLLPSTPRTEP